MIYIISEKTDMVTDLVTEWLNHKGRNFKRFNVGDFVKSKVLMSSNDNEIMELKNATKVWQRRGTLSVLPEEVLKAYPNRTAYLDYLLKEVKIFSNYREFELKEKLQNNYIGSLQKENENNKLVNLAIAQRCGLNIPNTLVTTCKSELQKFHDQFAPIISKDLRAPVMIHTRHKDIISKGVELVNQKSIDRMADQFAPIFLQQYIEKEYEIRIFIACGKIYSMAIFSQKDNQTKIDYRNYNEQRPNRCVPVKLPEAIEKKVWKFMEAKEMNTGSMDIIRTPEGAYVFLEINPMGQFHWLSQNCNYQIEKEIAKFLSDEKN